MEGGVGEGLVVLTRILVFFWLFVGGDVVVGVRVGDFDADFGDWTDFLLLVE
ncbi:MAG TPA: hypothetical protein VLL52_22290 [Anaerolineae bacterium]|nr:hypothetical protein [Anaerolineae bacterium]